MIHVISGHLRNQYRTEIETMHRLRARVFHDRLRWDVSVTDGEEIDDFDRVNPAYLLAIDDTTGRLLGCSRLLPTTGPNMLRDVFSVLLNGDVVESATIWESSRFAVDFEAAQSRVGLLSRTTSELLCGMVEVGLEVGLTQIVSVYDARMARVFRTADCPSETIGTPQRIGRVTTHAGLFEVSRTMWERLARAGGIKAPVIATIDGRQHHARHAAA